jgi:hypothetical protein
MPVGVLVNTVTASVGSGGDPAAAGTFFLSGLAERGSTTEPVLVRSMSEAARLLGNRVTYGAVHDQLETFFGESGGGRAYVARVVGPAATVGTLTLTDRAATPVPTLRVDASSPGPWSSDVTVEVMDGLLANTFTIIVRFRGETETYANLASPADAVIATAASGYVRLVNLGSTTAPPANNPAVRTATALSAGTDDRAAVVAADYVTALARFGPDLGAGLVGIPGQPYTAVGAGIAAHIRTHNRTGATAPAAGTGVTAAAAAARALRTTTGAEHLGFFYPWVTVSDGAGGQRTISPEGYVAGVRARDISRRGVGHPPAGEAALARHITGLERLLTRAEIDALSDDAVNTIRAGGRGVRLYGWRSLSPDLLRYRSLNSREIMNDLSVRGAAALERFAQSRTIDGKGQLLSEMATDIEALAEPLRVSQALEERDTDPGYVIDTASVNSATTRALGQAHVRLGIRPAAVVELIVFTISNGL